MSRVTVSYIGLLCILLWLTFLHGTSLFGFSEGYLKTRAHLNRYSKCEDVHELYSLPNKSYLRGLGVNESCWSHRKFERVVLLLVDSLRFDFCVMDPSYNDASHMVGHAYVDPGDTANIVRYYKNRLPVINETIWERPQNSRLFRFLADPPTATMQRIKALTTGSMPTFLEVSDNFASEAIHDDNWVVQMGNAGRKAVFMGDDTWMSMYPSSFAKSYPYPSFEVRDLHTVDNGVKKHLIPEIRGESFGRSGWHLILGHMLGVDHVGHRLGSNHPEMASKLAEVNIVISTTMKELDSSTLFVVMSDHGMNYEGNHGGATLHEMSASLFLYTPKKDAFKDPLHTPLPNNQQPNTYSVLSQIDIVPTISMLLGAPTPFGSLGMIIPDLFWNAENPSELLDPLHVNSAQLLRYLSELEKNDNRFPSHEMHILKEQFGLAVRKHSSWQNSSNASIDMAKEVYNEYKTFHEKAVDMCRRLWTTFDTGKMRTNLLITLGSSLIPGVLALSNTHTMHRIMYYASVGIFWAPLTWLVGWKSRDFPLSVDWILFVIQVASLVSCVIGFIVEFDVFFPHVSFGSMSTLFKGLRHRIRSDPSAVLATFVFFALLAHRCGSITSNSFIINAQQSHTFMTSTLIVLLIWLVWERGQVRIAQLLALALVFNRFSYHTFAGRHESYFSASNTFDLSVYTILPLLIIAFTTIYVVRKWLNADLRVLGFSILPQLLLAVYWCVQGMGMLESQYFVRVWIPRAIFASTVFQLLYVIVSPFVKNSSVFARSPEMWHMDSTDGGMTEFVSARDGRHIDVHSVKFLTRANFSRVLVGFIPTVLIILGPASPLPILGLLLTGTAIAAAASTSLHRPGPKTSFALLSFVAFLWSYLAYTYFYATSHLPVFTALQMSAGFIGIDGFSLFYSGFLVLFNAFFSHFILALAVPILGCNLFHFDEATIQKITLVYSFIYSCTTTATCASSYLHRRHLFVWTVFAPYFLFESTALLSVDLGLLLGTVIAFASSRRTAPKTVLKTVRPRSHLNKMKLSSDDQESDLTLEDD